MGMNDAKFYKPFTLDELIEFRYSLQMHKLDWDEQVRVVNQCISLIKEKVEKAATDRMISTVYSDGTGSLGDG